MKHPNLELLLDLISRLQLFIFDLDGTIYLGNQLLPGALDFISYLKKKRKRFLFLSNNSSKSFAQYLSTLQDFFGDLVRDENLYLSTHSTIEYFNSVGISKVYILGTPAVIQDFERNEIQFTETDPDAVLITFDTTLTYEKLRTACYLITKGVKYYLTHPDLVCPTINGPIPDVGSFRTLIETATKQKPTAIFGKPNPLLIQTILKRETVAKTDVILFGDRLYTDIKMAKENGIFAVLMLTGESSMVDVSQSEYQPDFILRDFNALNSLLQD